jgi:hypothetical protein
MSFEEVMKFVVLSLPSLITLAFAAALQARVASSRLSQSTLFFTDTAGALVHGTTSAGRGLVCWSGMKQDAW